MESSIPNLRNLHDDHAGLIESINSLNDEALQNLQDGIIGYINNLYGDLIEENLRMDPQFRHLFENKQNCRGNLVSLEKKECVKPKYIFQKKKPKYKIVNRTEPKKLLEKIEPKSKMIMKAEKTVLKNVADTKDISGNNLGSYFLKEPNLLKFSNKESLRINEKLSSSIIPLQTKISKSDENDHVNNSTVENPTFFFIMNGSQIENPLVRKNSLDSDLHYWDLNENIQQNEIYFSNSDYNEKNLAETSSTESGITTHEKIKLNVLESQNAIEKGKRKKRTYNKENKIKLHADESKKFVGVNSKKKIKTRPAFDIEKYLKGEEFKKVERYKYNSGGHLEYCQDIKEKCIYNFKNFDEKKLLSNDQFSEKKYIASKFSKQEVKCDKHLNESEINHNCENKVVVENLPINNFSVETVIDEANLGVDFNFNQISPLSPGVSCGKNNEVQSIKINDSNKFKSSNGNEQIQNESNFEMIKKQKLLDSIQFSHSESYFDTIGNSSQNCEISPEKLKTDENDTKNMKEGQEAIKTGQEAKDSEQYFKKSSKIDIQDQEEMTVTGHNFTDKSINFSWNSSKIRSGNEKTEQIDKDYIDNKEILKSVDSDIIKLQNNSKNLDIVCSEVINHNFGNSNGTDSNKSYNLHNDNKEYNKNETILKVSNENLEKSKQKFSTVSDECNFNAHMNKYSPESDPVIQVMPDVGTNVDISENINQEINKNLSKGLDDEKTNDDCIIMSRNLMSESFSGINLHHTEFESIQQPWNSIISDKIDKVSLVQMKNETVSKLDKSEISIPRNLINHIIGSKNMNKINMENKTPFEKKIMRRSSLRNKTVLSKKNNIETHMLVKITYDKGNSRKNDIIHKEPRSYKTEEIECSSKRKVAKELLKINSSYNLRSSITKDENSKGKKIK